MSTNAHFASRAGKIITRIVPKSVVQGVANALASAAVAAKEREMKVTAGVLATTNHSFMGLNPEALTTIQKKAYEDGKERLSNSNLFTEDRLNILFEACTTIATEAERERKEKEERRVEIAKELTPLKIKCIEDAFNGGFDLAWLIQNRLYSEDELRSYTKCY